MSSREPQGRMGRVCSPSSISSGAAGPRAGLTCVRAAPLLRAGAGDSCSPAWRLQSSQEVQAFRGGSDIDRGSWQGEGHPEAFGSQCLALDLELGLEAPL